MERKGTAMTAFFFVCIITIMIIGYLNFLVSSQQMADLVCLWVAAMSESGRGSEGDGRERRQLSLAVLYFCTVWKIPAQCHVKLHLECN